MSLRQVAIFVAIGCLAMTGCTTIPSPWLQQFGDGRDYILVRELHYSVGQSGQEIVVPAGFVTDQASTPPIVWSYLPPTGRYSRAAIVHDFLYWTQLCTKHQADNLLLIAMKESNVKAAKRDFIYGGVVAGGESAWKQNARERQSGMPRIVPQDEWAKIDGNATWPQVRQQLMAREIADPPLPAITPTYCALGNSGDVPSKAMAHITGTR